jgi:hypothetical protein
LRVTLVAALTLSASLLWGCGSGPHDSGSATAPGPGDAASAAVARDGAGDGSADGRVDGAADGFVDGSADGPLDGSAGGRVDTSRDGAVGDSPTGDLPATSDAAGADPEAADGPESIPDGKTGTIGECLPDSSATLLFRTTGGLAAEVRHGDHNPCGSSVDSSTQVTLVWVFPVAGVDDRAALILHLGSLPRGQTAPARPIEVSVAIAGPMANLWDATDLCTVDITANEAVATLADGVVYKVVGQVRCSAPLPGSKMDSPALTLQTLEFTTGVKYP